MKRSWNTNVEVACREISDSLDMRLSASYGKQSLIIHASGVIIDVLYHTPLCHATITINVNEDRAYVSDPLSNYCIEELNAVLKTLLKELTTIAAAAKVLELELS